jgi:hypothetical protein
MLTPIDPDNLNITPQIRSGRTFLPLRFISETLAWVYYAFVEKDRDFNDPEELGDFTRTPSVHRTFVGILSCPSTISYNSIEGFNEEKSEIERKLKEEYGVDVYLTNITCELDECASKCSCEKAVCY